MILEEHALDAETILFVSRTFCCDGARGYLTEMLQLLKSLQESIKDVINELLYEHIYFIIGEKVGFLRRKNTILVESKY